MKSTREYKKATEVQVIQWFWGEERGESALDTVVGNTTRGITGIQQILLNLRALLDGGHIGALYRDGKFCRLFVYGEVPYAPADGSAFGDLAVLSRFGLCLADCVDGDGATDDTESFLMDIGEAAECDKAGIACWSNKKFYVVPARAVLRDIRAMMDEI